MNLRRSRSGPRSHLREKLFFTRKNGFFAQKQHFVRKTTHFSQAAFEGYIYICKFYSYFNVIERLVMKLEFFHLSDEMALIR